MIAPLAHTAYRTLTAEPGNWSVISAIQRGGLPVARTNSVPASHAAPSTPIVKGDTVFWSSIRVPSTSLAISVGGPSNPTVLSPVDAADASLTIGLSLAGCGLALGLVFLDDSSLLGRGRRTPESVGHPELALRMRPVVILNTQELLVHHIS